MLDLQASKGENEQEADFLIINYSKQYICNIEVKNTSKKGRQKKKIAAIKKAQQQGEKIRTIFEDWFPHLRGKWKFVSMIVCEHMHGILKNCSDCIDNISTCKDLPEKLKSMDEKMPLASKKEKHPDDLKDLFKNLLYLTPKIALPVRGNQVRAVQKAVQEAGSYENIRLWAYPNPQQRQIKFDEKKLILLGPWGCGKTLFLTAEAIKEAEKGNNVLYLFFAHSAHCLQTSTKKSLLALDLEEKFKEYEKIQVKTVFFTDGKNNNLMDLGKKYSTVMADEAFADINKLSPKSQKEIKDFFASKDTVWLALSNTYSQARIDDSEMDIEDLVKSWYPGFQVARMDTFLRMPAAVTNDIKSRYSRMAESTQLDLNLILFKSAKVPSNLVEGSEIKIIGRGEIKPLFKLLEEAFAFISKDIKALIAINDHPFYPIIQVIKNMITCPCKHLILALTFDVGYELAGRDSADVYLLDYETETKVSSGSDRKKDLVASLELLKGSEHPFIIDTTNSSDISSRASSKLIKIYPNLFLDMLFVFHKLLSGDHSCQDIMSRESRPKIAPYSFSSLIGKSLHIKVMFFFYPLLEATCF